MAAATQAAVPVVVIGYARSNGIKTMPRTFKNTPYTMTAFLDVQDSPPHLQYTKHNLEVVLNSLHPRSRALIIGPAIHPSIVGEMRQVWEAYVQRALREEGEAGSWKRNAFVSGSGRGIMLIQVCADILRSCPTFNTSIPRR